MPCCFAELGSVDEALLQRMLAMFPPPPAEEAAGGQEGGEGGAGSGEGLRQGDQQLPSLHRVIVELDGKFITGGRRCQPPPTAACMCCSSPRASPQRQRRSGHPPSSRCRADPHRGAVCRALPAWRAQATHQGGLSASWPPLIKALGQPSTTVSTLPPLTTTKMCLRRLPPSPTPPSRCLGLQMSRECFARYLKLTRRALSDAAAIAAAAAAGITSAGEPLHPLEECLHAAEVAAERGYGAAAGVEGSIAAGGMRTRHAPRCGTAAKQSCRACRLHVLHQAAGVRRLRMAWPPAIGASGVSPALPWPLPQTGAPQTCWRGCTL